MASCPHLMWVLCAVLAIPPKAGADLRDSRPSYNILQARGFDAESLTSPESGLQKSTPTPIVVDLDVSKAAALTDKLSQEDLHANAGTLTGQHLGQPSGTAHAEQAVCANASFSPISPSSLANTYPYNCMGVLQTSLGICSGMLLETDLVLTAQQCLFSCPKNERATAAVFYDRTYNASTLVNATAVRYAAYPSCSTNTGAPDYDFAVVRLSRKLEVRNFPPVVKSTARALRNSKEAYLFSYPDVPGSCGGCSPYLSSNTAVDYSVDKAVVLLNLRVNSGSAGGPVFLNNIPGDQYRVSNAIIGVASYVTNDPCTNGFATFQPGWNVDSLRSLIPPA